LNKDFHLDLRQKTFTLAMPFLQDAHGTTFHNSNLTDIAGSQYNHNYTTNIHLTEERALAALKPAIREGYEVPRCMEGTRQSVFKQIDAWLDDMSALIHKSTQDILQCSRLGTTSNILWISGSPGAGKSAIASTLVSNLTKRWRLGSSFFFKRGDATLSDPTALWRTVASDLAQFHPCLKDGVIEFLNRPSFRQSDIMLHFECMIEALLVKNELQLSSAPPVVVIDALDECGSDDSQSAQRRILLDTLTRWSRLPQSFKLVITSRDQHLPDSFYDQQVCRRITLETGDSIGTETQNDIRTFFQQSFSNIKPKTGMASTWPNQREIDRLTERAAGLFIWAKTAMAFMEESRDNASPPAKLKLILAGYLGKHDNIDVLYQQILDFSFRDADDTMFELFRAVVGTIIVAKTPLHRDDLKHFVGSLGDGKDWQINVILHNLSSVIERNSTLRLRHLSFAEFLTDAKRCRNQSFLVDQNEWHRQLVLACLRTMKTELKFNICDLETSYARNDDVTGLPERIGTMIAILVSGLHTFVSGQATQVDLIHC
jgi:NACHT domain